MKSILDQSFRYTRSIDTDVRKTFARIRHEQHQEAPTSGVGEEPRSGAAAKSPQSRGRRVNGIEQPVPDTAMPLDAGSR
jgi:hypothetical protein